MARVHHRKARKDYPDHGITKGDMYYFCQIKTGPRSSRILRSVTPFKRSQLTSSEFMGAVYDFEEQIEALELGEDLADEIRSIAEEIRSLGEEQYDKLSNMPEGLQQGDTGQLLEGRQSSCDEWADNLESVADNIPDRPDKTTDELDDEPEALDEDALDWTEAKQDEWAEAYERWETERDEATEYDSAMEAALEEVHGYCYEGE